MDRRGDIKVILRFPRIAPEQSAVLWSDTHRSRTCEENDLGRGAAFEPHRTALANRVVQSLPDDRAVLLVQSGNRLSFRSTGMHVNAIADHKWATTETVLRAIAIGD